MTGTIERWLMGMLNQKGRQAVRQIVRPIANVLNSQAVSSAGLVIKAGGGVLAKTGASTTHLIAGGKAVSIPAATDMASLLGLNIAATKFNCACFFVDAAGTLSVLFGTEGATRGTMKFPSFPIGKALVGYLIITYASPFVGNTTPLDTATTEYISPIGAVDPSIALQ